MAKDQRSETGTGPCDVCKLVDGDETPKRVGYCSKCDAYMCSDCRNSTTRRAAAMSARAVPAVGALIRGLRQGRQ